MEPRDRCYRPKEKKILRLHRLKPSPMKMKTFRKMPLKNLKKAKRKRENLFLRILMKQKNWI